MLERSDLAENALQALHDEDYDRPFNTQSLHAGTLIFTRGQQGRSLDRDWTFCVDLLDTGLRQEWFALPTLALEDRAEPWDSPFRDGRGAIRLDADLEGRSPDRPVLHEVTCEAVGNRAADRVGFRTVERCGTEILVNGRPVFLRDISVHEDDTETGKRTKRPAFDVLARHYANRGEKESQ